MQLVHSLQVKHELALCIVNLTKYSRTYFRYTNVTNTQITDNEHVNSISLMMSSLTLCVSNILIHKRLNHHAFSYHNYVSIKVQIFLWSFQGVQLLGSPVIAVLTATATVDTCITCIQHCYSSALPSEPFLDIRTWGGMLICAGLTCWVKLIKFVSTGNTSFSRDETSTLVALNCFALMTA